MYTYWFYLYVCPAVYFTLIRFIDEVHLNDNGIDFNVTEACDFSEEEKKSILTSAELEKFWPGMSKRVKSGKPWKNSDNEDNRCAVLSILKKVKQPTGTVMYCVELSSPINPKHPYEW